jgi:manganese transport protein
VTRLLALIPAVAVILMAGERSTQGLLILSQVILSLQLSFAVIPLIHFTSNRRNMGEFATPWWGQVLAWTTAAIIVALNARLVWDKIGEWVAMASESGISVGPIPLDWLAAAGLYGVTGGAAALLVWVTIKPLVRRSPAWRPKPSVELDWVEALRPRTLGRIGVALEHERADAEILNRALGLAQSQAAPSELVLLHVVDTAMTRVLGPETADLETGADERYLDGLVRALRDRGYRARAVLLYGPDPAGELVAHLRDDPVDLLVVGSHGHGLVRDLLLGQTVDRVRHHLEVPMLIARPGRDALATAPPPPAESGLEEDGVTSDATA